MYARARLEKSLIRSVTNTFSLDRHSLTTVLKLSFPRFCFKDTREIKVNCKTVDKVNYKPTIISDLSESRMPIGHSVRDCGYS